MTVATLIEQLKKMPQEAIVCSIGEHGGFRRTTAIYNVEPTGSSFDGNEYVLVVAEGKEKP